MKKFILIPTVIALSLMPHGEIVSRHEDHQKPFINCNSIVLVKFRQDVDNGKNLYMKPKNLHSIRLSRLLRHFEVKEMQAVFKNRYSKSGKLMPNEKYSDVTSTYRYLSIDDSTKAKELSLLLQKEKGVLLSTIEKPISIKFPD